MLHAARGERSFSFWSWGGAGVVLGLSVMALIFHARAGKVAPTGPAAEPAVAAAQAAPPALPGVAEAERTTLNPTTAAAAEQQEKFVPFLLRKPLFGWESDPAKVAFFHQEFLRHLPEAQRGNDELRLQESGEDFVLRMVVDATATGWEAQYPGMPKPEVSMSDFQGLVYDTSTEAANLLGAARGHLSDWLYEQGGSIDHLPITEMLEKPLEYPPHLLYLHLAGAQEVAFDPYAFREIVAVWKEGIFQYASLGRDLFDMASAARMAEKSLNWWLSADHGTVLEEYARVEKLRRDLGAAYLETARVLLEMRK